MGHLRTTTANTKLKESKCARQGRLVLLMSSMETLKLDLWVGCERVGELAKGEAVVSRPGTRMDGYSPPHQESWFSK